MSLRTVGFGVSLAGVSISVGLVSFLLWVHRGAREEVKLLLRGGVVLGVLILGGAMLEWVGAMRVFATPPVDTLVDDRGLGILMRLVSGLMVIVGLAGDPGDVGPRGSDQARWVPGSLAAVGIIGVVLGVLSFSFDGHTVSEGPRLAHAAMNVTHVTAGGVWVGGLLALTFLAWRRRRIVGHVISPLLARFSRIATWALVVVGVAGLGMSLLIVESPGDYLGTPWGRVLVVKVALVAIAAAVGAYNHFVTVPALERNPGDDAAAARGRRALGLEAAVLIGVLAAAAILTTASPDPTTP